MFGELEDSDIYVNNQDESYEEFAEPEVSMENIPGARFANGNNGSDNKKLLVYVLVLVVLSAGAVGSFFYKKQSEDQANAIAGPQDQQQMGDYFYDQAKENNPATADTAGTGTGAATAAPSDTAVVDVDLTAPAQNKPAAKDSKKEISAVDEAKPKLKEKEEAQKSNLAFGANKHVVVAVTNGGRNNPFAPYRQQVSASSLPPFELIAPPADIPEADPITDELMATKISGIMYDNQRPSAIINFDGNDHLVHKGDKVKGYTVIDITKDRVVLKYGTNIYRAAVGQEIDENVKFNEVSNLHRQFGGAYASSPQNMIYINGK